MRQRIEVIDGVAFLGIRGQMRGGHRPCQAVVALFLACEDEQMVAFGVGFALLGFAEPERQLSAEHGFQLVGFGGLRHSHDPVEAVVVGQCEGMEAKPDCLLNQFLG